MTTATARYGFAKIVLGSDNVDVVGDFNNNWDAIDTKLGAQVCTFSTKPSLPPQGMTAWATDTNSFWVNDGTSGTPNWVNINPNSDWLNVVTAYGADPTGVVDATSAIQSAINAASATGAVVYLPPGTFKVTPVSSTSAALVLNNGTTTGYQGVRIVGAGQNATIIKRAANGPIITMSGAVTDTSGVTHCRYCTLENIQLHGNSLTGTLMQTYFADNLLFSNVHLTNSNDVLWDTAEFWDSRSFNVLLDSSGSLTADAVAPMLWLRNSANTTGFGYSTGTVNNLYFFGCRWEQYKTGAVRIERGLGTNTGQPYSLYFIASKFETAVINGGSAFFCDTTARDIHVNKAHAYAGGFYGTYATAHDVFNFGPQFGSIRDVLVFNATNVACIANGVTVNSPLAGATVTLDSIRGSYTGGANPTGAHINFGTNTGYVSYKNLSTDNGTLYAGNKPNQQDLVPVTTSTTINTTGAQVLQSASVPAGDMPPGSVYSMKGHGQFTTVAGSPTMVFAVLWNAVALCSLPAITVSSVLSGVSYEYEVLINFSSPTSVVSMIRLSWVNTLASGSTNTYTNSKTATTVVTSAASTLAVNFTWSAAGGNTITALGGRLIKEV